MMTMVTPLEILLDPVSLSISGMYLLLIAWEAFFPARTLPRIRFWQLKGIAAYVFFLLLSTYVPVAYASLLPPTGLVDLTALNTYGAALIGVLVYEFGLYWWHRWMHAHPALWRIFHQMHHSAERLDTFGAFYFSPMDMLGFTVLGTICFSLTLALPVPAITLVLLVTNFFNVFQHANIKTPRWLGYVVQRPESHSVHHAKGIHAFNYSDLPLFDILFGTFRNPKQYMPESGFYEGASARVTDMLTFKDISAKEEAQSFRKTF